MSQFIKIFFVITALVIVNCNEEPDGYILKSSGTIEVDEVRISPLIAGRISKLSVKEGDSVKKGDLLTILSADELSDELQRASDAINVAVQNTKQAHTNFLDAQTSYKRTKDLFESGVASQQNLDSAETRYKATEIGWRSVKAQEDQIRSSYKALTSRFNETKIYSPINGVVLSKNFEEGETVFQGNVLYTLADIGNVYLQIYIPEDKLGFTQLHQKTQVKVDSFKDKVFDGEVTYISSRAEFTPKNVQTEDSRTRLVFAIKISIPNADLLLKPGMPADGYLIEK